MRNTWQQEGLSLCLFEKLSVVKYEALARGDGQGHWWSTVVEKVLKFWILIIGAYGLVV